MADNRNFVNKFANQGGGDIFVEDAKLSESTSTTTMTTEGVLLKGTDGAYYEIDKTSLSEVIRAELGNILADNSKNNRTSVGKVPTLNSSGNALGASSIADLASVLGVEGKTHTINNYVQAAIISSFDLVSDYNPFDGTTTAGTEGRWIGFKHGSQAVGIYFSLQEGLNYFRIDTNKNLTARQICKI